MGYEELLAALRAEGERKAAMIREKTAAEAARLRAKAADGLVLLKEKYRQELAREIAAQDSAIIAEAEREARRIQLAAEEKLAERLFELARRLLPRLRNGGYPAVFARLAAELPPDAWEEVRVNPADAELAAALFPAARIVTDAVICGGLEGLADGGRVQIVNTLEKRLERGWPELLPLLLGEIVNSA